MLKLTKTGIGLLTKQYRSVLRKCLFLNLGLFTSVFMVNNSVGKVYDGEHYSVSNLGDGIVQFYQNHSIFGKGMYILGDIDYLPLDKFGLAVGHAGFLYKSDGSDTFDATVFNLMSVINLDSAIGSKIANDGKYIKASNTNSVTANLSALDDAFNYYYTFRVDESNEVIDYTSFFQKDFSTLQEVDLHIKNPTHLGAFTKCNEVCPRPSERFSSSLRQEQMLKNDASIDAGTFSICNLQIENVNEKLSNVFEAWGGVPCLN